MQRTPIEWTDFSANPLKFRDPDGDVVWGCVHASPGCKNCYSEQLAHRYGRGGPFNVPTMAKLTPFLDEKELRSMLTYKPASGKRCFPFDMTDVFGEWVPDEMLDRIFAVFALRPDVTWQILTKRAERMREYMNGRDVRYRVDRLTDHIDYTEQWPLPNVWLGVSCENQPMADKRIVELLQTPAAVRFISAEPLLEAIDLHRLTNPEDGFHASALQGQHDDNRYEFDTSLDWVIVGGESGPKARPCDLAWVRSIVAQCQSASVPVFVKQLGAKPILEFAPRCDQFITLKDRKGGDQSEWPEGLRIRQFPEARA